MWFVGTHSLHCSGIGDQWSKIVSSVVNSWPLPSSAVGTFFLRGVGQNPHSIVFLKPLGRRAVGLVKAGQGLGLYRKYLTTTGDGFAFSKELRLGFRRCISSGLMAQHATQNGRYMAGSSKRSQEPRLDHILTWVFTPTHWLQEMGMSQHRTVTDILDLSVRSTYAIFVPFSSRKDNPRFTQQHFMQPVSPASVACSHLKAFLRPPPFSVCEALVGTFQHGDVAWN